MKRPVWLFSMDSDQFNAVPTTTGGLKAYFHQYGTTTNKTNIELVHFLQSEHIEKWQQTWQQTLLPRAQKALELGITPIVGFSFYTWNAAEFLSLSRYLRSSCEGLLIIAGGPHVQQAEDYLFDEAIDLVFLGEGEASFQEVIDCEDTCNWPSIPGLAYLDKAGDLHKTAPRQRLKTLDDLPSALDVIELRGHDGKPLYDSIAYETSRGCPYTCAFCEWGTGAIGTKMYQFSMPRIKSDWQRIVDGGINDIWLADSNFGALKEDLEKTKLICEFKETTGLPTTFATSWSKKHSPKTQEIVMLLHKHDLLPHYQLALQTLTPLALELSNRKNMSANKYEPIAKEMAEAGVPIAAELIWGLPGDNLADFETNLDKLITTFPNINIFGYTLLPGTEFYRKREKYKIDAIPVAGYGKAKGEYVVGCHTFDRQEGIEGYFLISAHILFIHGHVLPLTTRFLALSKKLSVSKMLRQLLANIVESYGPELQQSEDLQNLDMNHKMQIYENRDKIYITMLNKLQQTYKIITNSIISWLHTQDIDQQTIHQVKQLLMLDQALCPRVGKPSKLNASFDCDVLTIKHQLEAMELPTPLMFDDVADIQISHPGGVGEILLDPDGGSWLKGKVVSKNEVTEIC